MNADYTEKELEEKYSFYIRTMNADRRNTFNTLNLKEKQVFLETLDEYFSVLYKQQKEVKVEDIRDDVNWIYTSIGYKPPEYIYINASLDATNDALVAHYKNRNIPNSYCFNGYVGLIWEANVGNFAIFSKLGYFKNEEFERYKNFLLKGIFDYIAFQDAVFVTRCPLVKFDDQGRPHCISGPALQWADHRGDVYFIHGVRFDDSELYWKIVKRELPAREIINLPNISMREVAISLYGYEQLLGELDAKIIDRYETEQAPPFRRKVEYILYEVQLNDDFNGTNQNVSLPAKFIKVIDASSATPYLLRVRPEITTIREAIPRTFRQDPNSYWRGLKYET